MPPKQPKPRPERESVTPDNWQPPRFRSFLCAKRHLQIGYLLVDGFSEVERDCEYKDCGVTVIVGEDYRSITSYDDTCVADVEVAEESQQGAADFPDKTDGQQGSTGV